MGLNTAAKNEMLDHLATVIGFVSAHSADPGADGANELSGGTPPYARQAVTWGPSVDGVLPSTNDPEFNVPAGATVAFVGFWTEATGGVFHGSGEVDAEVYNGQGVYTTESITLTAS